MSPVVYAQLPEWVSGDGEVVPISVGQSVSLGLGIIVDGPVRMESESTPSRLEQHVSEGAGKSTVRARSDVTGVAHAVRTDDGSPFVTVVEVGEIALLLLGNEQYDHMDGCQVSLWGDIVAEPYFWGEGGLIRKACPHGHARWIVKRIRELRQRLGGKDAVSTDESFFELVDLETAHEPGGGAPLCDCLLDLELAPQAQAESA